MCQEHCICLTDFFHPLLCCEAKIKRMVRHGGEGRAGVGRFDDVRYQVSGVTKEIICLTPRAIQC
jgi:hypothetical protein